MYTIFLDRILPLGELDLVLFDDQVRSENATGYFATVLAMTDVTTSLFAEKIVIVDFDGDSLAEAGSFHFLVALRLGADLHTTKAG